MTTIEDKVLEGVNNPLVTPDFTGTDQEVVAALTYWGTLVGHVRNLAQCVTGQPNRLAMISHLERELALLKAEFDNVSAVPVQGAQPGVVHMRQPDVAPDPKQQAAIATGTEVPTQDKVVSPEAAAGAEPALSVASPAFTAASQPAAEPPPSPEPAPAFNAGEHADHMRRMAGISKPVNRLAQAFKSYVKEPTVAECDEKPADAKPYDVTRLARIAGVPKSKAAKPKLVDGVDVTRMAKIARAPKGS